MSKSKALIFAAVAATLAALPARASTYDITLTQNKGTLITGSDFTGTGSFSVSNSSPWAIDYISDLSITIAGVGTFTDTGSVPVQFGSSGTSVNSFGYFYASDNGYTLSISGIGNSNFNLYGPGTEGWGGRTDVGSVSVALATTPIPSTLPLFAGGLGAFAFFMYRRRNGGANCVGAFAA